MNTQTTYDAMETFKSVLLDDKAYLALIRRDKRTVGAERTRTVQRMRKTTHYGILDNIDLRKNKKKTDGHTATKHRPWNV